VGKSFASSNNNNNDEHLIEGKNSEEYISRIVAEHVGTLKLEKCGDVGNGDSKTVNTSNNTTMKGNESMTSSLRQSGELQSSGSFVVGSHHVKIFPVVSNDEACGMFVRSYEKHNLQLKRMGTSPLGGGDGMSDFRDVSSFGDSRSGSSQNISHYLLQIEPR